MVDLAQLAAALADAPDELEPLVRMKVRFRASRSPTRTARTVAIGALEGEVATRPARRSVAAHVGRGHSAYVFELLGIGIAYFVLAKIGLTLPRPIRARARSGRRRDLLWRQCWCGVTALGPQSSSRRSLPT